jgi:hypothetical protein
MQEILTVDMDDVDIDSLSPNAVQAPYVAQKRKYTKRRFRQTREPEELFAIAINAIQTKRNAFSIYQFLTPVLATSIAKRTKRQMFPKDAKLASVKVHKIAEDKAQVIGVMHSASREVTVFSLFNKTDDGWIMQDLRTT